jgi:putative ABC transport system ATP-binding protein
MEEIIVTENISKKYQLGDNEVIALDNVNIRIKKGEFVAIVGTSGSGKSTLMNLLGCLDMPTTGNYYLEGVDIKQQTEDDLSDIRNKKIGFIFQSFNLVPNLNAMENVELPLIYRGVKRASRRELAKQALSHVGLEQRFLHLPSQMSGGQQQRVAIARAIAARPPIILADEPTGNLDKKSGKDVMDILLDLNKEGKTIVLITHDIEIAKLAHRQICMSDGKVVS